MNKKRPPIIIIGIPIIAPIIEKHAIPPKTTINKPIVFLSGRKDNAAMIKITTITNVIIS
jgi:hypothetical protein